METVSATHKMSVKGDYLGVIASWLCLVHCILPPLLIGMGQWFSWLAWFPEEMDYAFIFLAWIGVGLSNRKSMKKWLRMGLWGAVIAFSIGVLGEDIKGLSYLALLASTALIVFHLINIRYFHQFKTILKDHDRRIKKD